MRCWFAAAFLLLNTALSNSAWACSFVDTPALLGNVSSFVVRNGPSRITTGAIEFACANVSSLTLVSGPPSLRATIASPVNGLTLKNATTGDVIPYTVTGANNSPYVNGQVVINLSGTAVPAQFSAGAVRVPFNISTTYGPNVVAGIYTDTITLLWSYQNICEGLVSAVNLCLGTLNNSTNVSRTLTVSLTVTNDCSITAPDIQFGAAPLLNGFNAPSQNIGLLCTKGLVYSVGLSLGNNPASGRRQMALGSNRLQYNIFKSDGTIWGPMGTARASGIAAATGLSTQLIPYTARIYTDQPLPPIGNYSDNIVVDISF